MASSYRAALSARPTDPQVQGPARGEIARMDAYCFPDDEPVETDTGFWWLVWKGWGTGAFKPPEAVAYAGLKDQGWGLAYLCRAGVMPGHRGQGLQRKLIQARVRYARQLGLRTAITDTTASNLASANNLIRCGFVLYRPEYQWAGPEALYWWLTL